MRTNTEQRIADAKVKLFKLIVKQFGEHGLVEYIKMERNDRLAWEAIMLPGVNTTVANTVSAGRKDYSVDYKLTQREREIIQFSADGLSNAEMASEIGVALSTVAWHICNICHKTHSHTMSQVVAKLGHWEPNF